MTSTSKLGDEFLHILKLEVLGFNWVLYKERFFWVLDACAILEHINGIGGKPIDPVLAKSQNANKLSDEEKALEKEWKKELRDWKQGKTVAKQQIASTILDSLFMKIQSKTTAYEIWKDLEGNFQNHLCMVSVYLH